MIEDGVGAALVVVRGALVFAEEKGVDVGFTAVIVEASVVEVTAVVVGAAFVGGFWKYRHGCRIHRCGCRSFIC